MSQHLRRHQRLPRSDFWRKSNSRNCSSSERMSRVEILAIAFLGNAVACVGRLRPRLFHDSVAAPGMFRTRREQAVHSIDESRKLAHVLDLALPGRRTYRRRGSHELCRSRVELRAVAPVLFARWCVALSAFVDNLRLFLQLQCIRTKWNCLTNFRFNFFHRRTLRIDSSLRAFLEWLKLAGLYRTLLWKRTPLTLASECAHGYSTTDLDLAPHRSLPSVHTAIQSNDTTSGDSPL
jgi:hypothetical protein